PKLQVVFDTDPGIDDAMALLLLARHPEVELLGVTTVFGNGGIETVTRNALHLKDRFGFTAPVAQGAAGAIDDMAVPHAAHLVHGDNGLGGIALPATIHATLDPRPAHQLIIDLIRQRPGEITGLVKEVVVMGGAFGRNGHTGNVTPVAEANIFGDPVAADIAFGATWPVVIVGLDRSEEHTSEL